MKKQVWLVVPFVSFLLSGISFHAPSTLAGGLPVPAHIAQAALIGFPRSETHLNELIRTQAEPEIRKEAWDLFAELTEGLEPRWEKESWDTKCTLNLTRFKNICLSRAVQKPNGSIQSLMSTIFYNQSAADWIKKNHLDDSAYLMPMIKAGDIGVPPFPRDAIVVKEIWAGFNDGPEQWQKSMTLTVYDPLAVPQNDHTLHPMQTWHNIISLARKTNGSLDTEAPCENRTYPAARTASGTQATVPIQCFFFKRADQCQNLVSLAPVSEVPASVDLSGKDPCTLVLLGVQIATKEMDEWTWNTYWWTNDINSAFTQNRPSDRLRPAFWHFAMDTILSPATTRPVFNPYLEGPQTGGTTSNCLTCHTHAAYTAQCEGAGCSMQLRERNGIASPESHVAEPLKHCMAGDADIVAHKCQLQTSFLWSLATNQDASSTELPLTLHLLPGKVSIPKR